MNEIRAGVSAYAASAACLAPHSPGFVQEVIQNDVQKVIQLSGLFSILHFYSYR